MTPVQAAWLAGVLEGEGYFGSNRRTLKSGEERLYLRVSLEMTDRDVVEKVAKMWGGTVAVSDRSDKPRRGRCALTYRTNVCGSHAKAIAQCVLPHMGKRRSARIRELLATCTIA